MEAARPSTCFLRSFISSFSCAFSSLKAAITESLESFSTFFASPVFFPPLLSFALPSFTSFFPSLFSFCPFTTSRNDHCVATGRAAATLGLGVKSSITTFFSPTHSCLFVGADLAATSTALCPHLFRILASHPIPSNRYGSSSSLTAWGRPFTRYLGSVSCSLASPPIAFASALWDSSS
eukprot:TRINITY_DN3369_c0_g1_i2.p1 TRINITY_DN3369_c0_g1~~TRINITY_DN3369_c0_g1_i2.p1  ORF type:complete len:179 (-),score=10.02 TRINITY_DN3369_c0_g1_i2:432-968(-)